MKKENDEFLVKKFPEIFADRYKDMRVTAMCWGFDCGDGWFDLIYNLCKSIQSHINFNSKRTRIKNKHLRWLYKIIFNLSNKVLKNKRRYKFNEWIGKMFDKLEKEEYEKFTQVVASQVKEKYGGLCFYYYGGDDYIDGMVSFAEQMSYKICEICGTNQNVGKTKGWVVTICKKCYKKKYSKESIMPVWEENDSPVKNE